MQKRGGFFLGPIVLLIVGIVALFLVIAVLTNFFLGDSDSIGGAVGDVGEDFVNSFDVGAESQKSLGDKLPAPAQSIKGNLQRLMFENKEQATCRYTYTNLLSNQFTDGLASGALDLQKYIFSFTQLDSATAELRVSTPKDQPLIDETITLKTRLCVVAGVTLASDRTLNAQPLAAGNFFTNHLSESGTNCVDDSDGKTLCGPETSYVKTLTFRNYQKGTFGLSGFNGPGIQGTYLDGTKFGPVEINDASLVYRNRDGYVCFFPTTDVKTECTAREEGLSAGCFDTRSGNYDSVKKNSKECPTLTS